jgi:Tfp pilus assembly protein PilN
MTASETPLVTSTPAASVELPPWRRALVFGAGFGLAIGERHLEAAIARARPSGPAIVAAATIRDFRSRPAAEWGAELLKFLAAAGESGLAATVLLPRDEVIVRTVSLPGVPDKEVPGAIDLQVDTLHPWGAEEVVWGWSRAGRDIVLVGLARKALLDSWETLFAEAGILTAAATFSASAVHAALRIWSAAPPSFLCFATGDSGRTEIYGESESRGLYSAEFALPLERALAIARAELRLPPDAAASTLSEVLPAPKSGGALPLPPSPLAWAAALAGAAPRVTRFANLLPPERRASHDRMQFLLPAVLASVLLGAVIGVFLIFPVIEQKRYLRDLDAAARKLQPAALRAQTLERQIAADRRKIATLDDLRARPQADLDVLNELSRLLPPQVWTNAVEIYPDSVVLSGEADQAAALLKLLDSSPFFQNSEFALSVTRNGQTEQFRIKSMRRGRIGRTTP